MKKASQPDQSRRHAQILLSRSHPSLREEWGTPVFGNPVLTLLPHFITSSCYHRRPYLNDADRKDEFLRILEELRQSYEFVVVGYVLMPEHLHLLLGEPNRDNPSSVMFALKQRTSRRWLKTLRHHGVEQFWQRRFYDFNVFNQRRRRAMA